METQTKEMIAIALMVCMAMYYFVILLILVNDDSYPLRYRTIKSKRQFALYLIPFCMWIDFLIRAIINIGHDKE